MSNFSTKSDYSNEELYAYAEEVAQSGAQSTITIELRAEGLSVGGTWSLGTVEGKAHNHTVSWEELRTQPDCLQELVRGLLVASVISAKMNKEYSE